MSQRGAIKLSLIVASALGLGFGASAFLNYQQYQRAQQDQKLLRGQITDLKYQVAQDHQAPSTPTPSADPSVSPSPSTPPDASSPTPTVLGASTAARTATIKKAGNLHQDPSTSSKILLSYTKIPVGATVTLGSTSGQFQQITVNGVTGYILASYLQY